MKVEYHRHDEAAGHTDHDILHRVAYAGRGDVLRIVAEKEKTEVFPDFPHGGSKLGGEKRKASADERVPVQRVGFILLHGQINA